MNEEAKISFKANLDKIRRDRISAIDSVGDISSGVILRHRTSNRWAFLLPDATEQGRWRCQYFDADGFSGHWVRDTKRQIVEETVGQGFMVHDQDALDRLQATKRFQRGNYISGLIFKVNSGIISRQTGDSLLEEFDSLN